MEKIIVALSVLSLLAFYTVAEATTWDLWVPTIICFLSFIVIVIIGIKESVCWILRKQ